MSKEEKREFVFKLIVIHHSRRVVENILKDFLEGWLGRGNYYLEESDETEPLDGDH
jgi:hypothetical protein